MTNFTLDTGALIAFERQQPGMKRLLELAIRRRREITIPTVCIGQSWRGEINMGWVNRLLRFANVVDLDVRRAMRAGELLARTKTTDLVDATVAVCAAERGDTVITSDPQDLLILADNLRTIRIVSVDDL